MALSPGHGGNWSLSCFCPSLTSPFTATEILVQATRRQRRGQILKLLGLQEGPSGGDGGCGFSILEAFDRWLSSRFPQPPSAASRKWVNFQVYHS